MFRLLLVLCFFLSGCTILSINLENDVVGHTDNNYTNGFNLKTAFKPKHAPKFLESIPVIRLSDSDPVDTTRYVIGLRQDMYTPDDLKATEVVKDENPYAGTLTIDTERIVASYTKRLSTKIRAGTSGPPSLAGKTQIFVHDTMTDLGRKQTHPAGWDNQIEAEPLLNLDFQRDEEHFRVRNYGLDFTSQSQVLLRLGNINTDIIGKIGIRIGHNLPYLNNENEEAFSVFAFSQSFSAYRLHNIYYDGGVFRESVHTIEKEPFIIGLENGIGVGYKSYNIKFLYNIQTKSYKAQADDTHAYGLLVFGTNW